MFCPECRAEYREGYHTCSDCNVPLVEERPPEPVTEFVDYEQVLHTYNPFDISLLKSLLDAEGIAYYFHGEHFSYVRPMALPTILMVRKDHAERAREITRDLDLTFVAHNRSEEETAPGATGIGFRKFLRALESPALFAVGAVLWFMVNPIVGVAFVVSVLIGRRAVRRKKD